MRFLSLLIFLPFHLFADPIYDFWDSSTNTNKKNRVEIKNTDLPRAEYLNKNDTIKPNLAKDLDSSNVKRAKDVEETTIKDRYLRYNLKGEKDPQIAKDLDPSKIKLAPDYIKYSDLPPNKKEENSNENDEKDREESFLEIIPYVTIGNSLFEISRGEYSARVLDDSISAAVTLDLGLNYIWSNRNIGYLWNINLGSYDFNEKDRTNPDAQSKGEISGYIMSIMPTIFYELNRAQKISVLIGYGAGTSYLKLDGSATLANSNDETITNEIKINQFYFSHGLLIEILHNNLMVAFTKVKIRIEEDGQNIKVNENRLNIGYKFSF